MSEKNYRPDEFCLSSLYLKGKTCLTNHRKVILSLMSCRSRTMEDFVYFGGYLSVLERCVYDGEGSLCPSVQFWCPALSPVARWSPLLNLVRTDEGFKSSSERPVPQCCHYICGPRFSLAPHRHHGLGQYLELLLCTRNTHPPSTFVKTLFLAAATTDNTLTKITGVVAFSYTVKVEITGVATDHFVLNP